MIIYKSNILFDKCKKIILFLIILETFAFCSFGQEFNVKKYNSENGLGNNYINHFLIDQFNNIWIGTQGGLFVFDGKSFHKILHLNLNPRILYIQLDKFKDVYIVDSDFKIFKQESKSNPFEIVQVESNVVNKNFHPEFPLFTKDNYEDLIYKTVHPNLEYHQTLKNLLFQISKSKRNEGSCFYPAYITLGSVIIENQMILLLSNKNWVIQNFDCKTKNIKSDLPLDFFAKGLVFHSSSNTLLLYENKIYKLILKDGLLSKKLMVPNIPIDKNIDAISVGFFFEPANTFIFGSKTKGLITIEPTTFETIKHDILKSKDIFNIFGNSYYSQTEFEPDNLLVGNYINFKNSFFYRFINPSIPYNRAFNFTDTKERLWYNVYDTLYIKFGDNYSKIKLKVKNSDMGNYEFSSIIEITDSSFYLINNKNLLHFFKGNAKSFMPKVLTLSNLGIPSDENGQYLYYHKGSKTIFILTNKNIYSFDDIKGKVKSIDGLTLADYRIITEIQKNIFFVGTYGQGYFIYDGKNWSNIPSDPKGYLKFAHTALLDDHGHVWISTNNGLFRTRLEDIKAYLDGKVKDIFYYYYDKSSGFLTNEFNGGCQSPAIRLKNGKFSFSSMDGLVQFDPLQIPAYFPSNPMQILGLSLNDQLQDSIPNKLSITQDIKDIKLEISTAYYGHSDNFVIQYRIKGYVDEWKDLTDKRYITLQNASHGDIQIEIRKRNGFGPDAYDYMTYPVQVLPYFYQTWWFISILFLIGFLLTYLFSRWYNRYMIQKNIELEKLIAQKNEGLLQINNELEEKIKQSDLFQSILVHDIKSPLRFIVSTSKLVLDFWPSVKDDIKKENISHIHESASKIKGFVNEALLWIQIRNGDHRTENNNFRVSTMLSENINLYREDSKIISGAITISMDCDPSLHVHTDKSLLSTIMRNLLANSIKYTDEGIITLYAYSKKKGDICVGCRDNGKGMSTAMIEKIMDDDYKGNSIRQDSFRMGYIIIKEITKLLGAQLTIQSKIDKGTDVWVVFSNQ